MLDIVAKRYWFFGLSLLIIIPGLVFLIGFGLPLGLDFRGGSLLELKFESGKAPQPAEMRALYTEQGFKDSVVQSSGLDVLVIRSEKMEDAAKVTLVSAIEKKFNSAVVVNRYENVDPAIGQEVVQQAAGAVVFAAFVIMGYIWLAFRGVPNAHRYGISAIIAMFHDILVIVGIEAILGKLIGWEADALFLTALLTVIGFSVHDTIVVFDRIRENAVIFRKLPYSTMVNHSIIQTLDRSINTQLTVMITLLALALLGGATTQHFVVILLVGIFSGTYSSIFNAASILVVWENQDWKTWFRRKPEGSAA